MTGPVTEDGEGLTLYPCACGRTLTATKGRLLPCCATPAGIIHRLRVAADEAGHWDPDVNPPFTDWSMVMEAAADMLDENLVTADPVRATFRQLLIRWFREDETDDLYGPEDRQAVRFAELQMWGINPYTDTAPDPRQENDDDD